MQLEVMVRWAKRALAALGVGAGVFAVILAMLVTFQEKLIYIPRIPYVDITEVPTDYNLDYEDVWLESRDKTKLHAWLIFPKGWTARERKRHTTIIFLQENAGNMSMRLPYLADLLKFYPCTIAAVDYRGYGKSSGKPNEHGIKQDTQAFFNYLVRRSDIDSSKISIMGKSLGGATGIHLAAANPEKIQSIVVENTFTSIEEVAHKVFPPLKYILGRNKIANVLIRNKWRNYKEIHKLKDTPTLLLSSVKDEMLPSYQMRELYSILKQAGGKDVTWVEFERAGHMDAYVKEANYWPSLIHFLKSHSGSVSDEDSEGFEDIGDQPVVQAMLRAERNPDVTVTSGNYQAQHHEQR